MLFWCESKRLLVWIREMVITVTWNQRLTTSERRLRRDYVCKTSYVLETWLPFRVLKFAWGKLSEASRSFLQAEVPNPPRSCDRLDDDHMTADVHRRWGELVPPSTMLPHLRWTSAGGLGTSAWRKERDASESLQIARLWKITKFILMMTESNNFQAVILCVSPEDGATWWTVTVQWRHHVMMMITSLDDQDSIHFTCSTWPLCIIMDCRLHPQFHALEYCIHTYLTST